MQDLLVQLCRDAGHVCRKEGKALDSTRPGDVLVLNWLSGKPAAVDVTIRDPLLPSGPLSGAAAFPAWQEKLEHNKVLKYTRQCTTPAGTLSPFYVTSTAALGNVPTTSLHALLKCNMTTPPPGPPTGGGIRLAAAFLLHHEGSWPPTFLGPLPDTAR